MFHLVDASVFVAVATAFPNLQNPKLSDMIILPVQSPGLEIRESVRDRLLRQRKAVAAGERGEPLEEVREPHQPPAQWRERWETLAQKVERAWKTQQSAVEMLAEMRR